MRPPFLSQDGEDRVEGFLHAAWGEQAKAADGMPIALWNMLAPTINELFRRALDHDFATQLLVCVPKSDHSLCYVSDPPLSLASLRRDGQQAVV
jgi:hypothetical protein